MLALSFTYELKRSSSMTQLTTHQYSLRRSVPSTPSKPKFGKQLSMRILAQLDSIILDSWHCARMHHDATANDG